MTPDHYGYTPCPTCGVLAPEGKPHPATFCARERPAEPGLFDMPRQLDAVTGMKAYVEEVRALTLAPLPPLPEGLFHVGLQAFNECRCSAKPVPHCARCCEQGTRSCGRCETTPPVTVDVEALWGGT